MKTTLTLPPVLVILLHIFYCIILHKISRMTMGKYLCSVGFNFNFNFNLRSKITTNKSKIQVSNSNLIEIRRQRPIYHLLLGVPIEGLIFLTRSSPQMLVTISMRDASEIIALMAIKNPSSNTIPYMEKSNLL